VVPKALSGVSLVSPGNDTKHHAQGKHEPGEHNGPYADMNHVYFVWSDNRVQWTYHGTKTNAQGVARYQPDIRLSRLPWP
jgi:hypothetical protein